jgi:biopolymer transport protein TolR
MAFSAGSGGRRSRIAQSTICEINVTPLVDVMLVLLVIFMVASAIESARLSREAETLRQVATDETAGAAVTENQVPVNLPKAKADVVPKRSLTSKPILTFDARQQIWLGKRRLANCKTYGSKFDACLDEFEKNLQGTASTKQIRDIHLRADRKLPYGRVLALMARMRRVGITRFGLVTEAPKVIK